MRLKVVFLCPFGWPAVILSEPYSRSYEPNPNLYYLVCPHLRRQISRFEDGGLMRRLQLRIQNEPELAEDLRAAHEAHRSEWKQAVSAMEIPSSRQKIEPPGIAATEKEFMLKCLHAHFAWYLTHPQYRLGGILSEELGMIWCREEDCRRMIDGTGKGWPESR
ncbi:MAG: DUF501 domain-containing protein [Thermoleophilia bacterium]|nr:DUF501 domain-containing protein [Thermoleophilia bacterium]